MKIIGYVERQPSSYPAGLLSSQKQNELSNSVHLKSTLFSCKINLLFIVSPRYKMKEDFHGLLTEDTITNFPLEDKIVLVEAKSILRPVTVTFPITLFCVRSTHTAGTSGAKLSFVATSAIV